MRPVLELLEERGAGAIPHPGGTLLAHLRRVHAALEGYGARPALRLAGLAHAFYGTDGFPVALGDVARRGELREVLGPEAERIVRLYCGCDRAYSHPRLAGGGAFRDRFTGAVRTPAAGARADFAELTVANEVDVVLHNAELRASVGPELFDLFSSWEHLLSGPAREAFHGALAPRPG